MIEIDGKIVSCDIITEKFLCDLGSCRGICCVEGNAGAPLEADEARILAEEYPAYRQFMVPAGVAEVERQGFAVTDSDGDLVTPLVNDAECVYSYKVDPSHAFGMTEGAAACHSERGQGSTPCHSERGQSPTACHFERGQSPTRNPPNNSVTLCAIEKAWAEGLTTFRKPISCHLYPIRVTKFGDGSLGLNYHRWAVCDGARALGRERGVPVFRMLRDAIVRRWGTEFFSALEAAEEYLNKTI
jgi:hypothetical protein